MIFAVVCISFATVEPNQVLHTLVMYVINYVVNEIHDNSPFFHITPFFMSCCHILLFEKV